MTRPRVPLLAAVLVAAVGLSACGTGTVSTRDTPTTTVTAPGTTAAPATPSGTVAPDAPGVDLVEFFLRGTDVGVGHRRVGPTAAVARAALDQLLAGPDATERTAGLSTAIASGLRVTALSIADGTADVTFSGDLAPAADRHRAEAQVVFTLSQFPTVTAVRIAGGAPLTRAAFADVTPHILVLSPAPGQEVRSPVTIAGLNNSFESTFQAQVLDADRRVLVTAPVTGKGEMGTWGPFAIDLTFSATPGSAGYVRVFDISAESGARVDLVDVPVRFP